MALCKSAATAVEPVDKHVRARLAAGCLLARTSSAESTVQPLPTCQTGGRLATRANHQRRPPTGQESDSCFPFTASFRARMKLTKSRAASARQGSM